MLSRIALACLFLAACGSGGVRHDPASPSTEAPEPSGGEPTANDEHVEEKVIVQKTAHGTKKTIVRTTTRTAEAPSPAARPEDPIPDDPLVRFNLDMLNRYRKRAGVAPLLYDAKISSFALAGSRQLASDHRAHAHFAAKARGAPGFGSHTAENQGDPSGVPALDSDRVASGKKQITKMLEMMFDEGPGGGHHDNMLNPKYRRIGIGVHHTSNGTLYLTNDFSD